MRRPVPFGNYLLLDRIAVGGMAEVFAAKSFGVEGFERTVAIKRILPNMVEDDEFIAMFIDEARIAAQLSHSNIAQIYELGRHDEAYFIAMEYVSGRDVRLLIDKFRKKGQPVPLPMATFILAKMAEGLDYAHSKSDSVGSPLGIIHRDISPQNVLVSYDGDVKIIDFGIAKAAGRTQKTQAGILKGKFAYMSPEQVRGIAIDYRSDLYSAGVMFYEMVTGTRLFSGESDFSTLEKVRAGDVRPPSELNAAIPPALEKVVLRALAKDRDERYQTGGDLHDALMRHLYSGREIYSAKNLAAYMKEAFGDEHRKELERLRRWRDTKQEEAEFQQDDGYGSSPRKRVRLGGETHSPGRQAEHESEPAPEPEEAPPESVDGQATQVKAIDIQATQVRAIDVVRDIAESGTAIIQRPAELDAPAPPARRERTVILDQREIVGASILLAKRKRRSRALPSIAALAGAAWLGFNLFQLQVQQGQQGALIVIKGASNAQASVDGAPQPVGSGTFIFRGAPTPHALKITADGYIPFEKSFSVADAPLEVTLEKDKSANAGDAPTRAAPPPPSQPSQPAFERASAYQPSQPSKGELSPEARAAAAAAMAKLEQARVPEKTPQKRESAPVAANSPTPVPEKQPEAPAPPPPPPPPVLPSVVELSIQTTTPPSAMVQITVAGKNASMKRTPTSIPNLHPGDAVDMKFVAPGFVPTTKHYVITGSNDAVTVEMAKLGGDAPDAVAASASTEKPKLKVLCIPRANVMVDGQQVAHTSGGGSVITVPVEVGTHEVWCVSETGAESPKKQLSFVAGQEVPYKARIQ